MFADPLPAMATHEEQRLITSWRQDHIVGQRSGKKGYRSAPLRRVGRMPCSISNESRRLFISLSNRMCRF
jgi:hypothetical protein